MKHTMDMISALEWQLQKSNPVLHILTSVWIQSPLGFRTMSPDTRSFHVTLRMLFCFICPSDDEFLSEAERRNCSVRQRLANLVDIVFANREFYSQTRSGKSVPVKWQKLDGPQLTQLVLNWIPDLKRLCFFLNKMDPDDDDVPIEELEFLTEVSIQRVRAQGKGNICHCSCPLLENDDSPPDFNFNNFNPYDSDVSDEDDDKEEVPVQEDDEESVSGFHELHPWTKCSETDYRGGNLNFLNRFLLGLSPSLELSFSKEFFQAAFNACHCFLTATCSSMVEPASSINSDQAKAVKGRSALWCLHYVLQGKIASCVFDREGSEMMMVIRLAEKFPVFKDTLPILMAHFFYGFENANILYQQEMRPKLSSLLTYTDVQLQQLDVGFRPQFGLPDFFPLPRELENREDLSCFLPEHLEFHDASNFRQRVFHFFRFCLNFLLPDVSGKGAVIGFCDDVAHVIQSYLCRRDQLRAALFDVLIRYYHFDCYEPIKN